MQVGEESKKKKKKKKKKSKNGERYSVGASFSLLFLERNVLTQEAFQRKLSGKRLSVLQMKCEYDLGSSKTM